MGTRILKIDSEMAEKIEVEDGNPNFNFFAVKKFFFYQKCHNLPPEYTYYISENSGNLLIHGHTNFED